MDNDRVEGSDAASSRRVPWNDRLGLSPLSGGMETNDMTTMDKSFDGSDAHILTKKGKPDMRRKVFSTAETTAKRVACAKKAGYAKLAKKAARTSQAEYAERFFTPAMMLLAKIEAFHNGSGVLGTIPDEITELCNAYYGEVRPCV